MSFVNPLLLIWSSSAALLSSAMRRKATETVSFFEAPSEVVAGPVTTKAAAMATREATSCPGQMWQMELNGPVGLDGHGTLLQVASCEGLLLLNVTLPSGEHKVGKRVCLPDEFTVKVTADAEAHAVRWKLASEASPATELTSGVPFHTSLCGEHRERILIEEAASKEANWWSSLQTWLMDSVQFYRDQHDQTISSLTMQKHHMLLGGKASFTSPMR